MVEKMLLRDRETYPKKEILKDALGDDIYGILDLFIGVITSAEYGLNIEWRYYNDGKAWLGKIQYKKKTILWLSIWEGFFKTSFNFTEKHLEAIATLDISASIKENIKNEKPSGRLIPMIIDIKTEEQLKDLLTIVRFKKSLK